MKKYIFLLIYFINISGAYATTQYEKDPHKITIKDIINWYQADIGLEKEPPGVDKHPFSEGNGKGYLYDGELRGWAHVYFSNGRLKRKLYYNPDVLNEHYGRVLNKEFDYFYYQGDVYVVFGDGKEYPMFWLKNDKPYNGMLTLGFPSVKENSLRGDLDSPSENSGIWFKLYVKNGLSNGIAEINSQKGNFKNGFRNGYWDSIYYDDGRLEHHSVIKYNMGEEIESVQKFP